MSSPTRSRSGHGSWPVRAFVFASVAVLLSAFGHSLMTGTSPAACTLLSGAAAASLFFAPLARRRLPVPMSAGSLCALQIGLHVFFAGAGASSPMPHGMTAEAHTGMAAGPTWVSLVPTVPMACGHIVASASIAWVLHGGDTAAERILGLAHLHVARGIAHVVHALRIHLRAERCSPPDTTRLVRCSTHRPDPAATGLASLLVYDVIRRGPPPGVPVLV
ncbi:hypothetical protein ACE1OC_03795 [Streptomyces sp. DSM 116496]|uniref:hypothetical protein n=1 Tax=Streptomyces stoeckheimensis TaxID=3344656 RepID=UPI0038B3AE3F